MFHLFQYVVFEVHDSFFSLADRFVSENCSDWKSDIRTPTRTYGFFNGFSPPNNCAMRDVDGFCRFGRQRVSRFSTHSGRPGEVLSLWPVTTSSGITATGMFFELPTA